jgi:hypothetical protein
MAAPVDLAVEGREGIGPLVAACTTAALEHQEPAEAAAVAAIVTKEALSMLALAALAFLQFAI